MIQGFVGCSRKERDKAKEWWDGLTTSQRFELGDAFVLGTFDWGEWEFKTPPSSPFLREVDYLRVLWESMDPDE